MDDSISNKYPHVENGGVHCPHLSGAAIETAFFPVPLLVSGADWSIVCRDAELQIRFSLVKIWNSVYKIAQGGILHEVDRKCFVCARFCSKVPVITATSLTVPIFFLKSFTSATNYCFVKTLLVSLHTSIDPIELLSSRNRNLFLKKRLFKKGNVAPANWVLILRANFEIERNMIRSLL